jgi:pimeloyl-ACP methyl ester carboxylesterase
MNYNVPTMSIAGTRDGLYRLTRAVEGYFHQVMNIQDSQAGKFPVKIIEGISHGTFMDEDILPSLVKSRDLNPSVSQEDGHS